MLNLFVFPCEAFLERSSGNSYFDCYKIISEIEPVIIGKVIWVLSQYRDSWNHWQNWTMKYNALPESVMP